MTDGNVTDELRVGDILFNEPADERIVVIDADENNVWLRKVEKNDELVMIDGSVYVGLGKNHNIKDQYSQRYAQRVFELDGHVDKVIAVTPERRNAKSHPYGYEPDTGAYDCTRCKCGCINDISATYCNDCGGEIEIDESAEKELYHHPRNLVFAEKHDDGSLEFGGKRYVAVTLGLPTLTAKQVRDAYEKHYHNLADEYDMPEASALPEFSYDWTAIADELNAATLGNGTANVDEALALLDWMNEQGRIQYADYSQLHDAVAELGGGTCEWTWVEEWIDTDAGRECDYAHWTLDCGCWDVYDERFQDYDDYESRPEGIRFCERCGRAVKR